MQAVGGAVPVGVYFARGAEGVENDPTATNQGVPALWAQQVAWTPPAAAPSTCSATTRKGKPCPSARVGDTELCVGHWNSVLAAFPPAEVVAALTRDAE